MFPTTAALFQEHEAKLAQQERALAETAHRERAASGATGRGGAGNYGKAKVNVKTKDKSNVNKSKLEKMERVVTRSAKDSSQIGGSSLDVEGREDKKGKGRAVDVGTIGTGPPSLAQGSDDTISIFAKDGTMVLYSVGDAESRVNGTYGLERRKEKKGLEKLKFWRREKIGEVTNVNNGATSTTPSDTAQPIMVRPRKDDSQSQMNRLFYVVSNDEADEGHHAGLLEHHAPRTHASSYPSGLESSSSQTQVKKQVSRGDNELEPFSLSSISEYSYRQNNKLSYDGISVWATDRVIGTEVITSNLTSNERCHVFKNVLGVPGTPGFPLPDASIGRTLSLPTPTFSNSNSQSNPHFVTPSDYATSLSNDRGDLKEKSRSGITHPGAPNQGPTSTITSASKMATSGILAASGLERSMSLPASLAASNSGSQISHGPEFTHGTLSRAEPERTRLDIPCSLPVEIMIEEIEATNKGAVSYKALTHGEDDDYEEDDDEDKVLSEGHALYVLCEEDEGEVVEDEDETQSTISEEEDSDIDPSQYSVSRKKSTYTSNPGTQTSIKTSRGSVSSMMSNSSVITRDSISIAEISTATVHPPLKVSFTTLRSANLVSLSPDAPFLPKNMSEQISYTELKHPSSTLPFGCIPSSDSHSPDQLGYTTFGSNTASSKAARLPRNRIGSSSKATSSNSSLPLSLAQSNSKFIISSHLRSCIPPSVPPPSRPIPKLPHLSNANN